MPMAPPTSEPSRWAGTHQPARATCRRRTMSPPRRQSPRPTCVQAAAGRLRIATRAAPPRPAVPHRRAPSRPRAGGAAARPPSPRPPSPRPPGCGRPSPPAPRRRAGPPLVGHVEAEAGDVAGDLGAGGGVLGGVRGVAGTQPGDLQRDVARSAAAEQRFDRIEQAGGASFEPVDPARFSHDLATANSPGISCSGNLGTVDSRILAFAGAQASKTWLCKIYAFVNGDKERCFCMNGLRPEREQYERAYSIKTGGYIDIE